MDIQKYLSEKNSLLIIDADGNRVYSHKSDKAFRSASVIKIYILSYYLDHYTNFDEVIQITPEDRIDSSDITDLELSSATLYELMFLMICSSDNTATNLLIKKAGFDTLNNYCRNELHTKNTVVGRIMLDFEAAEAGRDNLTCLDDCYICLKHLMQNEIGKHILSHQQCRTRLMRYIYDETPFYGKAGDIPDVYNDVGFIGESIFAGVLSDGCKDIAPLICGFAGLTALGKDRPITC